MLNFIFCEIIAMIFSTVECDTLNVERPTDFTAAIALRIDSLELRST